MIELAATGEVCLSAVTTFIVLGNHERRPLTKRPTDFWKNLAGPPVRWSPRIRSGSRDRKEYSGFIKLRLAHSEGRTYLIPDVLIGVGGLRFFLPTSFSPPLIGFNVGDEKHVADFTLDVGPPRATNLTRLSVRIGSEGRLLSYDDGAQSWLGKTEQSDKWSFCLTAGKIDPRIRRDDEQTSTPEPHTGFQGEGGACRRQGRSNTGSTGGAVRRASQSDHVVESAA